MENLGQIHNSQIFVVAKNEPGLDPMPTQSSVQLHEGHMSQPTGPDSPTVPGNSIPWALAGTHLQDRPAPAGKQQGPEHSLKGECPAPGHCGLLPLLGAKQGFRTRLCTDTCTHTHAHAPHTCTHTNELQQVKQPQLRAQPHGGRKPWRHPTCSSLGLHLHVGPCGSF